MRPVQPSEPNIKRTKFPMTTNHRQTPLQLAVSGVADYAQALASFEPERRHQYATVQANLPNVLTHRAYSAMRARAQWFVYRLSPHPAKIRKLTKVPVTLDGSRLINLNGSANWVTAEVAVAVALKLGAQAAEAGRDQSYTAGFCITDDDEVNLVDLDKATDGTTWSAFSLEVYAMFPGAPFEVSAGLNGMHILPRGRVAQGHKNERPDKLLEVYSTGRGVALTGISPQGDPGTDFSAALAHLIANYLPAAPSQSSTPHVAPSLDEWNAKTEAQQAETLPTCGPRSSSYLRSRARSGSTSATRCARACPRQSGSNCGRNGAGPPPRSARRGCLSGAASARGTPATRPYSTRPARPAGRIREGGKRSTRRPSRSDKLRTLRTPGSSARRPWLSTASKKPLRG